MLVGSNDSFEASPVPMSLLFHIAVAVDDERLREAPPGDIGGACEDDGP